MTLRVHRVGTRAGDRALARLDARGATTVPQRVLAGARRLVEGVRKGGDRVLLAAIARHDGLAAAAVPELLHRPAATPKPATPLPAELDEALEKAIRAVERYHVRQAEHARQGFVLETAGVRLEERRIPLRRIGLYVPGGRFPYPSTVLMSALPARLAGVEQIVVATPPAAWRDSPVLRAAAERVGVDEVWTMGGAHAIAALAFGTETIERVDLIAGPGNAWVTAAKQLVRAVVGIDQDAGPSEVVIVAAGQGAEPEWIAADLLAQAEHDPDAVVVLVTPERRLVRSVVAALERQLGDLEHQLGVAESARASLGGRRSCALVVEGLEQALEVAERIAPEHLQLMGAQAETLERRIRRAGAVFVGARTPTVYGDYVAGPSHVLPTGGTARFASGLSVDDFLRRSHTVTFDERGAREWAPIAAALAGVEGLEAHRRSALARTTSGSPACSSPEAEQ
ncbi:MAG TPA: histidinol dehydrogenase [Thermoanaerobaculia bacterium]|nr:histidinol dehydrogenase [Thermoanaerobaculia bacterium]